MEKLIPLRVGQHQLWPQRGWRLASLPNCYWSWPAISLLASESIFWSLQSGDRAPLSIYHNHFELERPGPGLLPFRLPFQHPRSRLEQVTQPERRPVLPSTNSSCWWNCYSDCTHPNRSFSCVTHLREDRQHWQECPPLESHFLYSENGVGKAFSFGRLMEVRRRVVDGPSNNLHSQPIFDGWSFVKRGLLKHSIGS